MKNSDSSVFLILKKKIKPAIVFTVGLFIMAIGVALSVKANLGVSPISCIPYIFSIKYPLSLGTTTVIMNILLILLQIIILRKKYKLFQLIQLPVVCLFGLFIDIAMFIFSPLSATSYPVQAVLCILGCIVLAFGVFLEVKAKLTFLPGEGVALAVTEIFNIEFGKTKIGTDSSMVVIGIISSLLLLGSLEGIREGTVAAAFLVGYIVRFYVNRFKFIDHFLSEEKAALQIEETDRERVGYCKHYTGKDWRDADNYHLTIDSTEVKPEEIVKLITAALSKYIKE